MQSIRHFFEERHFDEVITPVFSRTLPQEIHLQPFVSTWQRPNQETTLLYAATSPESGLKKMLGAGMENCFAIGKSFRNSEESNHTHNPEFLMLEWYRSNATYEDIMDDVVKMLLFVKHAVDKHLKRPLSSYISYQGTQYDLAQPWQRVSLAELFQRYVGVRYSEIDTDEKIKKVAAAQGYSVAGSTWEELFDQMYLNEVEKHQPNEPHFLVDFPARISPLCAVSPNNQLLAQRFEIFFGGMELGNGNTENCDAEQVRSHFEAVQQQKKAMGYVTSPIDESFLEALGEMERQGKSFAGIGLGVDRLAMIMADTTTLRDVDPFVFS